MLFTSTNRLNTQQLLYESFCLANEWLTVTIYNTFSL